MKTRVNNKRSKLLTTSCDDKWQWKFIICDAIGCLLFSGIFALRLCGNIEKYRNAMKEMNSDSILYFVMFFTSLMLERKKSKKKEEFFFSIQIAAASIHFNFDPR